jgi:cytochrome c oxidase cbb3-type subunit III
MAQAILYRLLVTGVGLGALLTLGAATDVAPSDKGSGEAPTPQRLLDVPVTHIIPGNIEVKPDIKSPVAGDSGASARGMKYFDAFNCSGCHAANGAGGMGPALSNHSFKFGSDPANIYLTIVQGRPTGMPAWGTILPSTVIWDLVAYVESISNAPVDEWGTTTSLDAMKIEQVPAEFQSTPNPWQFTEPFSFGQKPTGEVKSGMNVK